MFRRARGRGGSIDEGRRHQRRRRGRGHHGRGPDTRPARRHSPGRSLRPVRHRPAHPRGRVCTDASRCPRSRVRRHRRGGGPGCDRVGGGCPGCRRPIAVLPRVSLLPARAQQPVRALGGDRGQHRGRRRRVRARPRRQLRTRSRRSPARGRGARRAPVVCGARVRRAEEPARRARADLRLGHDGPDDARARKEDGRGHGRGRRREPRAAGHRQGARLHGHGGERR